MYREDLNFKAIINKILFIYCGIYLLALIFRSNYDIESLLNSFHHRYLIFLNLISISMGLPLSIIFDLILIKLFGAYYILFFTPVLTSLGFVQIMILRKINFNFSRSIFFLEFPEKIIFINFLKKFLLNHFIF